MILACHRHIFFALGKCIALYPILFITVCLTASSMVSVGIIFAYFTDNFRSGYAIPHLQSSKEHAVLHDFYHITRDPYKIVLIGESTDGGSMLRQGEFAAMRFEIERGLSLPVNEHHRADLQPTGPKKALRDYVTISAERSFTLVGDCLSSPTCKVQVGFPYSMLNDRRVWTAPIMYGVENGSVSTLVYHMLFFNPDAGAIKRIKDVELQWNRLLQKRNARNTSLVQLRLFGDQIVDDEIRQGAIGSMPYFLIGAALMTLIVYTSVRHYDKGFIPAAVLTLWTILCPLLAATMSISCFAIIGIPINCVMFLMPFLVLGVGVDDAFLMMHKWFSSKDARRVTRLCSLLIAIGPSISLTSLTNVFAFLIGSLLSPPAVRTFCFCTALALVFDWLLQLFMFAPVLIRFYSFSTPTSAISSQKYESAFATYAKFIQKRVIRYSFLLMLIAYWMATGFFAFQMRENFSPEKTFDTNSYLAQSIVKNEKMYFDHEMIRVFFTTMPEDTHDLRHRMKLIDQIEYVCDNFTTWIDEYDAIYGRDERQRLQDHFANIAAFFVDRPDFTKLIEFEHTRDGAFGVSKLAFDICVHGFGSWRERALMVRDLRSRLPEGFSIHIFDSAIFDLILSSREAVIKSVLVTVLCMVMLCALFIPTLRATSVAVTSVASITIGMIGGLYLWGADLDTMVMVDIVMAIGMTVDFSAHISYLCFINGASLRETNKLAEVVQAVAFPTAQAALTTMACVVPLYFYRIYMYVTFAKTVILSAMIGFIHTVFVIPLLLSFLGDHSNVAIIRSPKHNGNRE